jgi:hypothetical protein
MSDRIKDPIEFSRYAILYMDVLGQREKLSRITDLPTTEAEYETFIKLLQDTYGVIDGYANMFEAYLSQTNSEPPAAVPEHFRQQFKRFVGAPIGRSLFSDSMLYYMSLNEEEDAIPTIRLHDLLRAAAVVFAGGLSDGNPGRGALEMGIAADVRRVGIYGPALYNAYALENNVAQYPRVVIGPIFHDYLITSSNVPGNTNEAVLRRTFAEKCLRLIYEDYDGVTALDYAGKAVHDMSPQFREVILNAGEFAHRELERFKKEHDYKHSSRY